jgi:restriction system protein
MEIDLSSLLLTFLSGMWEMRVLYLWIFIPIFIIIIFRLAEDLLSRKSKIRWLLGKKKVQELQKLTPAEFEDYIALLFAKLGYKTKVVGGKSDGGVDVEAEKDGQMHYIQCKKYSTSKVPVSAVRDFYGAIVDRVNGGKGYFITTNVFTLEAERFAEDKPIEFVDKFKLMDYIKLLDSETPVPVTSNHICPKCGGNLIQKKGKFGLFMGCSNFPQCTHTQSL